MDFKELLKAQGLSDDQIKAITKSMKENKIYTTSEENIDTRYAKLKEKKEDLETQLTSANDTIKNLKALEIDNTKLKDEIAKFETDKANYEKALTEKDFNYALEDALKGSKSKNNKLVKALLDMEKIKYEDGKIVGLDEQLKTIKEENSFLFEKEVPGAPDFTTGGGKGSHDNKGENKTFVDRMVETKTAEINTAHEVDKFFK